MFSINYQQLEQLTHLQTNMICLLYAILFLILSPLHHQIVLLLHLVIPIIFTVTITIIINSYFFFQRELM
jgi:hypothetical protein